MTRATRTSLIAKLFLFVIISTLGLAGLLPSRAAARQDPPQVPRTAVVEVTRLQGADSQRLVRFTVALAEDGRPARLTLRGPGASYNLNLRCGQARAGMLMVNLDMRWVDRGQEGDRGRLVRSNEVAMTSRIALGVRALMGKVERQDGAQLHVNVTVK